MELFFYYICKNIYSNFKQINMNKKNLQNNLTRNIEIAKMLEADLVRKEAEIKQVKKEYLKVYNGIVAHWKDDITSRFPNVEIIRSKYDGDLVAEFSLNDIHYIIGIGKGRQKLLCIVRLKLEDIHNGAAMSDSFVNNFKGILSYKKGDYAMFSEFDLNDYETAFSCFVNVIEKFKELQIS